MKIRPATEPSLAPALFPCPVCGTEAHIVAQTRTIGRDIQNALYGVECCGSKKHRTPIAFTTGKSAATFWNESAEKSRK